MAAVTPGAPGPVPDSAKAGSKAPESAEDIVVSGRVAVPGDPLAAVNAKSYAVIQTMDRAIVGPVAMGYKNGLPEPVRDGLHNFLVNLREPVVFLNFLLQLKPGKALRTLGRFAVNSSVGVGGVFDVARRKPFDLPHKTNGFEDTFACWGIGSGPYLFLPLIGPTTLRDVIGVTMGRAFLPFAVGGFLKKPYYALPAATIDTLDIRVAMEDDLRRIREESGDPYAASRDLYLRQRYEHLEELCPSRAAKAFRFPPTLKAELAGQAPQEAKAAVTPQP
jgi:phospholipid-binding lipoprotein MlaA